MTEAFRRSIAAVLRWRAGLVAAFVVVACCAPALAVQPWRGVEPAVVKVYGGSGGRLTGGQTGLIISSQGDVVTPDSPTLDARDVVIVDAYGDRYSASRQAGDAATGLCTLRPISDVEPTAWIDIETSSDDLPAPGASVWVLSNAFAIARGDESLTVQRGVVAGRAPMPVAAGGRPPLGAPAPGTTVVLLDAVTSNPGSPGGVVVDRRGRLIGLVGGLARSGRTGQWTNYAIGSRDVADAIARLRSRTDDEPFGRHSDSKAAAASPRATWRRLGVWLVPAIGRRSPPYVEAVAAAGVAERAGLRADDLLLSIDGVAVGSVSAADEALSANPRPRQLTVVRDESVLTIDLNSAVGSPKARQIEEPR